MLSYLHLSNFKSARDLGVSFGTLTVLTGLNGSGKSSVMQAIALLKQSGDADSSNSRLFLKGTFIHLGQSDDIVFDGATDDRLTFDLRVGDAQMSWTCEALPGQDVLSAAFTGNAELLRRMFEGFQYIQADRITPAVQYMQAGSADRISGFLGSHGEFTIDYLSRNAEKKIAEGRRYPEARLKQPESLALLRSVAPTDYLPDAVAGWLQLLSPGVRLHTRLVELADSASLRFQYKGSRDIQRDLESRVHRPSHVGFGLTYSLPIIVGCLAADPGSILLLENPEAHLHPRGQAALGLLLSLCAADGVQIIVETHSDHLLNGIRLAAKRKEIAANHVMVHFFHRDVETGVSECVSPILLDNGRFSEWPQGFFDEWSNALDELLEE